MRLTPEVVEELIRIVLENQDVTTYREAALVYELKFGATLPETGKRFRPREETESSITNRIRFVAIDGRSFARYATTCEQSGSFEEAIHTEHPERKEFYSAVHPAAGNYRFQWLGDPNRTLTAQEAKVWLTTIEVDERVREPLIPKWVIAFENGVPPYALMAGRPKHEELIAAAQMMCQPQNPFHRSKDFEESRFDRLRLTVEEAAAFILTGQISQVSGVETYILKDYFGPTLDAVALICDPLESISHIQRELSRAIDIRNGRITPNLKIELETIRKDLENEILAISKLLKQPITQTLESAKPESQSESVVSEPEDSAEDEEFLMQYLSSLKTSIVQLEKLRSVKMHTNSVYKDSLLITILERTAESDRSKQFKQYNSIAPKSMRSRSIQAFNTDISRMRKRCKVALYNGWSFSLVESSREPESLEFQLLPRWWRNGYQPYELAFRVEDQRWKSMRRVEFEFKNKL